MYRRFFAFILIIVIIVSLYTSAVFASNTSKYFGDMSGYEWAIDAVDKMYEYDLILGRKAPSETSYGIFDPSAEVTKAELSQILCRMSSYTEAETIYQEHWYDTAISFMMQLNLIDTDPYTNSPYAENYISREECFYTIYRFVSIEFNEVAEISKTSLNYKDNRYMSARYIFSTNALIDLGYIIGSNGCICPKSTLNRAELAVILYRIIKKHPDRFKQVNFEIPYLEKMSQYPEATTVWIILKSFGWSDYVCAGIMGNIMAEVGNNSAGTELVINPYVYGGGGFYYGICQWGYSWFGEIFGADLEAQCIYIKNTIKSQLDDSGYEYFLQLSSPEEAARYFAKNYEKCTPPYYTRERYARIAYDYFVDN